LIKAANIEQNYSKTYGLFFQLGVAYYNEMMYDKTDKMFEKDLELDPRSVAAWYNKGSALVFSFQNNIAIF